MQVYFVSTTHSRTPGWAQSSGPKNVGPETALPGHITRKQVLSHSDITPENNKKSGRSGIGRTLSRGQVAERQGFEPWVGLHRQRFSRPPHSTTLPPLRNLVAFSAALGGLQVHFSQADRLQSRHLGVERGHCPWNMWCDCLSQRVTDHAEEPYPCLSALPALFWRCPSLPFR